MEAPEGCGRIKFPGAKEKRAGKIRRIKRENEFGWRCSDLKWLPDGQVEDCHQSVGI